MTERITFRESLNYVDLAIGAESRVGHFALAAILYASDHIFRGDKTTYPEWDKVTPQLANVQLSEPPTGS